LELTLQLELWWFHHLNWLQHEDLQWSSLWPKTKHYREIAWIVIQIFFSNKRKRISLGLVVLRVFLIANVSGGDWKDRCIGNA
jgi:hypothetical protein